MRVAVVFALRDRQELVEVELPEGATAAQAVAASGLAARHPDFDFERAPLGLWSRPCARDAVLREGDRVEVYRGLEADAKALRRARVVRPSRRARNGR
jgi:putative ubiquitin-RnfH superfamily antitoxin RatB of RatAB toxin-antitoxin module